MLGDRIRILRLRHGLSQKQLAADSGVSVDVLRALESNDIWQILPRDLLALAGPLRLRSAYEFGHLLSMNGFRRKFRVYNVGRAKTGTTSIAEIFRNYRSAHEFMLLHTKRKIGGHLNGNVNDAELRNFVLQRDTRGCLEMDSASFNHYYLKILTEEFPWAKFVFTIRDCYSWVASVINFVLRLRNPSFQKSGEFDIYRVDRDQSYYTVLDELEFGFPRIRKMDSQQMVKNLPEYIDSLLCSWTDLSNKTLSLLPPENTLILRTHEISDRLNDLAEFVGVPLETLNMEGSHSRKGRKIIAPLRHHDTQFLEQKFEEHCGQLMQRFFPGYSFRQYLDGQKPPPVPDLHSISWS